MDYSQMKLRIKW